MRPTLIVTLARRSIGQTVRVGDHRRVHRGRNISHNRDLGSGVTVDQSPSGKAIKFQHRGAYEDIDSTYDVITAYLDAKGLQVDNPYIEEYLTDLTTPDDPNLQVDIYVFVK